MTRARLELLQWFALFAGPLAWATQHVVSYGVSDASCRVAGRQWDLPTATLQVVVAVAAALVVLAAAAAAFLAYRETQEVSKDAPGPAGRIHFFAQAALLGNVLFLALVVLDGFGTVYHLPCSQA